jgi:FkbM family methyltransferase
MPDEDDKDDRAARLLADGPAVDAPAGYRGLTRLARRLAARLTRHQTLHHTAIAQALHEGLEDVVDEIARVDGRVDRAEQRLTVLELRAARRTSSTRTAATATGGPGPADSDADGEADAEAVADDRTRVAGEAEYWRRRLGEAWGRPGTGSPVPALPSAVRLDTTLGPLLVADHDRVMLPLLRDEGWWEDDECDQLRILLQPGMTFVDIGAHVGFMTLLGARAVGPAGRVLAVEPATTNFALLRANILNNGLSNVEALQAAALDRTGTAKLSISPFNTGDHRAYPVPSTNTEEVTALALDDVIPADVVVDVVKVDAQGTDHRAILGMRRTLARSRSVLLVEFWPPGIAEAGEDPLDVLAVYRDLGYEVRVLGEPTDGPPPPPEQVVEAGLAAPGGFCSLVLRPSPSG